MSYEGYRECLCHNGHFFIVDAYDNDKQCPHCSSSIEWYNSVDDTNGEQVGKMLGVFWDLLLLEPAKAEKCNLGHWHQISPEIYRLPTKKEAEQFRNLAEKKKRT